jgi:hypothetical protein
MPNVSTDRSIHKWTPERIAFLKAHPTEPRTELIKAFRARFKGFQGSDTSIVGRRYGILNHGTGSKGLAAKVKLLETRLETARVELAAAEKAASAKMVEKAKASVRKAPATKVAKTAPKPVGKGAKIPKPETAK